MAKRALPLHREVFSKKKLELPPLAAFDFETDGLGGDFIVAAVWTSDDHRELFESLEDFFNWMLNHPQYRFLAHNAVGYEFAYLYPLIYNHFANNNNVCIYPTIQGDTRIVQLRIEIDEQESDPEPEPEQPAKRGRGRPRTRTKKPGKVIIDIRDTLCLFSMSLEKVAKAFCPELPKLKGNINFEKERFDPQNPEHIEYVYRDCEIVLRAYERHWNNVVSVFGCPLGVTAGSTALKAFKTTIPEGHVYYRVHKQAEELIRQCYYGGLVLPGHQVGEWGPVASVDVNGAYGYQMKTHLFPVGTPYSTHFYVKEHIGFYHVIASVPDRLFDELGFNPLPKRDKGGLCWPSGTFETFITSPEIEYARSVGCTVDVLYGYCFPREERVFEGFIDRCQEMEIFENFRYKPSIKQIRNSGYGKFGSKEIHKTIKFSHETLEGYEPLIIEKTGRRIEGLYIGEDKQEADYMLPHWAALITAYQRLYLMQFMQQCYARGAKNVYCDTDSIKCDRDVLLSLVADRIIPIGDRYGEFKLEEICSSFLLLGGKCFIGTDSSGEVSLMKAKGIPNRVLDKSVYEEGLETLQRPRRKKSTKKTDKLEEGQKEFYSVKSVMNIVKENSHVTPIKRKRSITDIRNSFAWKLCANGQIKARQYANNLLL